MTSLDRESTYGHFMFSNTVGGDAFGETTRKGNKIVVNSSLKYWNVSEFDAILGALHELGHAVNLLSKGSNQIKQYDGLPFLTWRGLDNNQLLWKNCLKNLPKE